MKILEKITLKKVTLKMLAVLLSFIASFNLIAQNCDDFTQFSDTTYYSGDNVPPLLGGNVSITPINGVFDLINNRVHIIGLTSFGFNGSNQTISFYLSQPFGNVFGEPISEIVDLSVNGGSFVDPYNNTTSTVLLPITINGVTIAYDTVTNILTFTGNVNTITINGAPNYMAIDQICIGPIPSSSQNCDDFTTTSFNSFNNIVGDTLSVLTNGVVLVLDSAMPVGLAQTTNMFGGSVISLGGGVGVDFLFDGSNQEITFYSPTGFQGGSPTVAVNNGLPVIVQNTPSPLIQIVNGVVMEYVIVGGIITSIKFTGNVSSINFYSTQMEISEVCIGSIPSSTQNCDNFTQFTDTSYYSGDNVPPLLGGNISITPINGVFDLINNRVHIIGLTSFGFDGSNQTISFYLSQPFGNVFGEPISEVVGLSVNGSSFVNPYDVTTSTTLLPITLNGVTIAYDTVTNILTFTGNVNNITINGAPNYMAIDQICITDSFPNHNCNPCQINADFIYTAASQGHMYIFTNTGAGTEHSWDFGDGNTDAQQNPTHYFTTSGTYNVCYTNYNVNDTCTETICKLIIVQCYNNNNIITPNSDGNDDQFALQCNNIKIYNRNGILINELISQSYWDGKDFNGITVPMGEYILLCGSTKTTESVTVIR